MDNERTNPVGAAFLEEMRRVYAERQAKTPSLEAQLKARQIARRDFARRRHANLFHTPGF